MDTRGVNIECQAHISSFKGRIGSYIPCITTPDVMLTQLVIAPNQGNDATQFPIYILGTIFDPMGQSVQYRWWNGLEIFVVDTWILWTIQSQVPNMLHISPHRWTKQFSWHPHYFELWNPLWKDYRAAMENFFLWQLMYKIPTTNQWRFPLAGQTQLKAQCSRCVEDALEDDTHCFWTCFKSKAIWD